MTKPDWGIRTFTCEDGRDHLVSIDTVVEKLFGNLIQFAVPSRRQMKRKVLLVAPHFGSLRDIAAVNRQKPVGRLRCLHCRLA